ncbi:G:T/U mismatch-specific DNA glycosylase [Sphaerochaeta pleomorpha str. Grapes]|uniref:G:T/U mismatch-specific DNA glycosylase n=1 Tax=Sphaerochaeta pleomorpha (strain ATCC BAA-1885 / DSM 22778 / Grapes) TaxID=158190 RepID=G8QQV5_SPHPG|nr:DNA-deoxyinosine glycosylase [Sphaerochaeta pleomorpha]AEV28736.1 G:T/U mismatch-specific DNA glycosylase [Sphaerochaeta pleomorpha str. Grapes]
MLNGFPPIESQDATILILGTGPSVRSLQKQQYYGHERNAFWAIMDRFFKTKSETYEQKWYLLQGHGIALWDVLSSFDRKGSLDSAYSIVEPNDLKTFIQEHGKIERILFNGKQAEAFYKKYVAFYPQGITFKALPSTSPAYTLAFEEKARIWGEALEGRP